MADTNTDKQVEISAIVKDIQTNTDNSKEKMDKLYLLCSPLIRSQINQYRSVLSKEEAKDCALDAIHDALLGFDDARGVTFTQYAKDCISHALCRLAKAQKKCPKPLSDEIVIHPHTEASLVTRDEMRRYLMLVRMYVLSSLEYDVFVDYLRGYKISETAKMLHLTEKQVKNAKGRALAKLKTKKELFQENS